MRLWNARVVDPGSQTVIERATIGILGDRIIDVGPAAGDAPLDAIDVGGCTVLPGFIDAHTHLTSDTARAPGFGPPPPQHGEEPRPRELAYLLLARSCRALLEGGVTTVRDVGSFDDEAIVMRRGVELGLTPGPRILSCGRIISATSPGGRKFGSMYVEADGPWELRRAVREQLRRGADFVKVMATGARSVEREDPEPAQLTREEMRAVVDEGHRLGVRVAAHAEGLEGTRIAVEEGVDTIEHGFCLHREPGLLHAMAERGQVLVPTLTTFHDLAERFAHEWVPCLVDQAKRQLDEAYTTVETARQAGVTIAMGFDSGPPGYELWELTRLADAGLGTRAALEAGTRGGALALGRPELGSLMPQSVADLVVVDGHPLEDIRTLLHPQRIRLVIHDGRPVAGRDLDPPALGRAPAADLPLELPASTPSPCCPPRLDRLAQSA